MTVAEEIRARTEARNLLITLWKRRTEIWTNPPSLASLIPIPVNVIARSVLGLRLEEPEEIHSDDQNFEVAGFIDRSAKLIVAAQRYRNAWRRFTIAHEIGHWVLHPDVVYHRDRPLNGGEQADVSRPKEEQEADKFASELLMPKRILTTYFMQMFGQILDGTAPTFTLAEKLSVLSQRNISVAKLANGVRSRSILIADIPAFRAGSYFKSLADSFGVSPTAMAIQLEDLGLVI